MSGNKVALRSKELQAVHRWTLDLTSKRFQEKPPSNLDDPVGYRPGCVSDSSASQESKPDIIVKKSWDVALGPLKQIPMNFFIMWMAGNSISIFPIMMVGMMFIKPIQALIAIQQTFKMIEGRNAFIQRFVYFLGNIVGVGLAMYKCQNMGLLPTHASDWLAFMEPQRRLEWSGGGMAF
ncbi:hypothetical protein CAPTEDRAFT_168580 [Capitella teleta]|uniref:ER membrane protein complex subunit 4 n=1 Tax=Capitella teleta TaxID=283909 RepID=R7T3I6_CAPTE|nr:hypothetical protein CAPTEDRAFT_168580 [Capitella teleta]|eukprot:ELT87332.1 hypothetical protein CAPTEDRAFT_168580 [Capitella teleta]